MKHGRIRFAAAVPALLLAIAVASPAQGSPKAKPQPKKPKYAATIEVTTHTRAVVFCDYNWISNWVFNGTYSPTPITGTATLDSRTRTASGTVDWTEDGTCLPPNESGSCSIGTETPIEDSAGYEDGFVTKAPGGFEVDLIVDNTLIITGTGCRGAVWGGPSESGGEYIEPHAFIAKSKIGQKTITAAITGSFSGSSEDGNQDGQMNGTLTLKRKGKR